MKTKDEIIDAMVDIMPFRMSDKIRPYIKEAMEIYAQKKVNEGSEIDEDQWKSISKNPPPDISRILATGGKDVYDALYYKSNGVFAAGQWQSSATHWMPRPKPPVVNPRN